jgi:hypothetical protein
MALALQQHGALRPLALLEAIMPVAIAFSTFVVILALCAAILGLSRRQRREIRLVRASSDQIKRYASLRNNGTTANDKDPVHVSKRISDGQAFHWPPKRS